MQWEGYWYEIILKCKISEKSIPSVPPMVGKASTAFRILYEHGSCKEDPSDNCIELLRSAGKRGCKMQLAESVRRIDVQGKLTHAFSRGITNENLGFTPGIQTE